MLEKTKEAIIDELATAVKRGELVVFLGSGLSSAAGVPSWTTLVKELKDASDVQDVSTRLQPLLAKSSWHIPDVYRLLAELPVRSVVTTNFDRLLEQAFRVKKQECPHGGNCLGRV